MPVTKSIELGWHFKPDLFEDDFEINQADCTIAIRSGRIIATTAQLPIDALPARRTVIEAFVVNLFLGAQVCTRTAYQLSGPTVTYVDSDGTRNHVIECRPAEVKIYGGTVDLIYTGADGVVVDTKADRIGRLKRLGQQSALLAQTDCTMTRMLRSHQAAILDPEDELIHLYEIRDAAAARLGGDHAARVKLCITHKLWSRFGELCNELPVKQGRHRGKANGELRDATEAELTEARKFAALVIEAYISYRLARKFHQ